MSSPARKLNELTDVTDMIYDTLMQNTQLPAFPIESLTDQWVSSGNGYIYVEFNRSKYHIQITKED